MCGIRWGTTGTWARGEADGIQRLYRLERTFPQELRLTVILCHLRHLLKPCPCKARI